MGDLFEDIVAYAGDDYDTSQDVFISTLIEDALEEVINAMYPTGVRTQKEAERAEEEALKRYKSKIRNIAKYHYDKAGKEGVTAFTENGTSHSYESAGTPPSYFRGIIPVSRII